MKQNIEHIEDIEKAYEIADDLFDRTVNDDEQRETFTKFVIAAWAKGERDPESIADSWEEWKNEKEEELVPCPFGAFCAWGDAFGIGIDEMRPSLFKLAYAGTYDSMEDFCREFCEDFGGLPAWMEPYVDYKLMALDLECDYKMWGGRVFRMEGGAR